MDTAKALQEKKANYWKGLEKKISGTELERTLTEVADATGTQGVVRRRAKLDSLRGRSAASRAEILGEVLYCREI